MAQTKGHYQQNLNIRGALDSNFESVWLIPHSHDIEADGSSVDYVIDFRFATTSKSSQDSF